MKRYLYILGLAVVGLTSCDSRNDFLANINTPPSLTINNQTMVYDTVKISLKAGAGSVSYDLMATDAQNNISEIDYNVQVGLVDVYQNNALLSGGKLQLQTGTDYPIKLTPHTDKMTNRVIFTGIDQFKAQSTVTVNLYSFVNMPPVANLAITPVQVLSPYEYLLDASKSFDEDQKWGGGIEGYTFEISGTGEKQTFTTTTSQDKIIFPGPGTYMITLTVRDIDGATSTVTQAITI